MARNASLRPAPRPEQVAACLRAAGLSVTAPRVAILGALQGACDHPSPEVLHGRLRRVRPDLSLGTVYKALHAFAEAGLVHEVSVAGENSRRFDANLDEHHHLVCTQCHEVRDLYDPQLDRVPLPRLATGFAAQRLMVHVLGRCPACTRTRPASRRRRGARRA
ncbi:MAG: Fur family transcriptional regulator [Planctomycetia bacterium]